MRLQVQMDNAASTHQRMYRLWMRQREHAGDSINKLCGRHPRPLQVLDGCDYFVVKSSAIGQQTWPTQPSIPQVSVNE